MAAILDDIVFQHAEDASALWHRRNLAASEPHYSLRDLLELDNRVTANIKGLLVAGTDAEPLIDELVEADDDGAIFTAALVAIESSRYDRFDELVDRLESDEFDSKGMAELASALAWVNPGRLAGVVKKLLSHESPAQTMLGLLACTAHGKVSESIVRPHLTSDSIELRKVAARAAANAAITGVLPILKSSQLEQDSSEKFEYARAMALLGDKPGALALLPSLALADDSVATKALTLYLRIASLGECKNLLKTLDKTPGRERDVVSGFGIVGDPVAMTWLIGKMSDRLLNRLAGESVSMITGVDIVEKNLELDYTPPEDEDIGPDDDPENDDVSMDEDEDLPWCNPESVSQWWKTNATLSAGQSYLAGSPRTADNLSNVLKNGLQKQRHIAAIDLAVSQVNLPYVDTRLPAKRQVEALR